MHTYGTKREIYVDNPANLFSVGRELEVILLQVTRRGGIRRKRFIGMRRQSRERVICENSKCSYIGRTSIFYCNKN